MLFRHNELGDQITEQHLQQIADSQREDRNAYYQRRYEMFKGIATDRLEPSYNESLCLEFFPKGIDETLEEYQERMKVWIPQGRNIIERLADLVFKGGVEYKFVAVDRENEADVALAKRATEIIGSDFEYNDWDITARERVVESLGIGQVSDWLDYRRHDPRTGELYDNGGRVRLIKRWPWFAEPVVHPDNVTEIIGAAYIYNIENNVISQAVTMQMQLDGSRKLVIELWLDPSYSTEDGIIKSRGAFARFENDRIAMPEGKEDWASENKYGLTPVVFWQSIDIDESQYNGESFVDRFVDMLIKLSRVASGELSGIQYIINQRAVIAAKEAMPEHVISRHNSTLKIPQGEPQPIIENLTRNLDLSPEQAFRKFLIFSIGQSGNYSADLMDIDGIGKVAQSGVARKIVYSMTVDCVTSLRKNFARQCKSLMKKIITVKLQENGGNLEGLDLKRIKPEVAFYGDIMPSDDTEELTRDIILDEKKIKPRTAIVTKYNDDIDSEEDALSMIEKIDEQAPTQQTIPSFGFRGRNGTPEAPSSDSQT